MTIGENAQLYGVTPYGGGGGGVAFRLDPSGTPGAQWIETVLYNIGMMGSGEFPEGNLALGKDGSLFGTSFLGGNETNCVPPVVGCGAVFELKAPAAPGEAWTELTLHQFAGGADDGANPVAGIIIGDDGALYGTTTDGPEQSFA